MTKNFFNDMVRTFFAWLDFNIYSFIEFVTQGIFDIAHLRSNVNLVETVRDKIYVILGIFMLFKISASLIQYMVNPDMMSDKEKGASKLISRTITMLCMLIALPTIFSLLSRIQTEFLPILPKFLLNTPSSSIESTVSDTSSKMSLTLLKTFFHPYYDESNNYAALDGATEITSLSDFYNKVTVATGSTIPILGTVGGYTYEYTFILSTIVGVIVLVLLCGIAFDIGIRFFKMLLLEMLAPIPIMSYVDPKSQKDGAFQHWLKELGKTFIDIFLKLGLVYLILFFIAELEIDSLFVDYGAAEGANVSPTRLGLLKVFMIIALLMFAKQAPKFIKGIFGIKDNKEGSWLGNVASGLAGFGAGAVSGAISGRGIRGAITGGMAGMAAGYQGAVSGKGSNAWQTGGDAAIQARLGDKNAKSGILASLQSKASKAQMRQQASRLNLTKANVDAAQNAWLAAQAEATEAEWAYRDLIARGPAPGESDADYNTRRTAAYTAWQDKVTESGNRERNYNKGKDAYEKAYGQDESAYSRWANGYVHRATKRAKAGVTNTYTSVSDSFTTAAGGRTIADRRDDRTRRTASHGGFDPDKH